MDFPIFGLLLGIACIVAVWYLFKRQDAYIDRMRDRYGDGSLRV